MPFEYAESELDQFIRILCGDSEPTFQTFSDRDELKVKCDGKPDYDPNAKVFHGDTPANRKALADLNKNGVGCFVMVNEGDGVIHINPKTGKPYKTCRNGHNVTRVRAFFVDLDGSPLQPVLDAGLTPHLVIESSPGRYHCYWLVEEEVTA